MKRIALITSLESPEISRDDRMLVTELDRHGVASIAAPWDDPAVAWDHFDLLLLRSCWNYHLHAEKFQAWINTITASHVRMANLPELILWNMNKHYLKELKDDGVRMPDSVWLHDRDFYEDNLHDILLQKNWRRAVLKPCISASSFRTSIVTPLNARETGKVLSESFPEGGMILQEFVETIPERGELSLIFFKGEYSHAVLKQAMPGEFRVQGQFGGSSRSILVAEEIVASAANILARLSEVPLYARVDGVEAEMGFTLMELELIEPVLFFELCPEGAGRLTRHIIKLL